MTNGLWGGRFSAPPSQAFQQFNDSLPFDCVLLEFDIRGSIAWAQSLQQVGVLTTDEYSHIQHALHDILQHWSGCLGDVAVAGDEDIHAFIERQLIERIGDLGKKLHTGRSRNDQVATDIRLWCRAQVETQWQRLEQLIAALANLAEREATTVIPGYTHLQRAQPVLFSHWCLAYVEMFKRDQARLKDALARINVCPLGSGALAGTAYPIDRTDLALRLGFSAPAANSLDAVSDRDFIVELLSVASLSMIHLSRMAEDLIFYASGEAGFVELADDVSSGSSLMPQKKNPDALELIRGKSGRVVGAQVGLLMTLKALPLAYNKDMQEDKEGLFASYTQWGASIDIAQQCVNGLTVNQPRALKAAKGGYSNATELADYLVSKGVPFRTAHEVVGECVQLALKHQQPLEDLPLSTLQAVHSVIMPDVYEWLSIEALLAKRNALGGTSIEQTQAALKKLQQGLRIKVRDATLDDIDAIVGLVGHWAGAGENLPRAKDDIVHSINEFAVSEVDGKVTGCASLYIYTTGLAEIRSLGVNPQSQVRGQGRMLVEHLCQKARQIRLKRVIVLTRVPDFFKQQGFTLCDKAQLPEKVMKDCELCPKKHCCDEIAMEYGL
ncbi:argininosuccinate lyase [Idiomarina sp. UBA3162]|uniref:argininosuccinate lyase n=1 Tax=unclassified Idiomarina TaxID=2614829 RepID=UPI000C90E6CB|nr:argininosuccinate lyase [Idiomarina sp. UBA3162]MAD54135.1 argininosuccinate lyase [Idiomarinaceae bacterium]MEC7642601.1 argininosuccinate lyase [Pseudomonadota bacterium]|tara:strand:- start:10889 stop:12718 length:1830 start_codon:yes stop_codon:yes gene_type:complete